MTSQNDLLKLEPLKEASLFYLKTDFALLAAAAITFTLFKVDPGEILGLVAFMSPFMYALMALVLLGLINHAIILRVQILDVSLLRSSIEARTMVFLVMLQTVGNVLMFIFAAGFIAKDINLHVLQATNQSL